MGELSYLVANASVMPVWLLMIAAPKSVITRSLIRTPLVPIFYAVLYAALLIASLVAGGDGGMDSLDSLRISFERDSLLLMAWVHYLCFDMVVGMWEVRDARRLGIEPRWLAPCLVFTLMLGPIGFAMYVAVRWFKTRTLDFDA